MRENIPYAKLGKCTVYQKKILYLGHISSEECVAVDPAKIKGRQEWPTLRNMSEVRPFMGFDGYYKKFI